VIAVTLAAGLAGCGPDAPETATDRSEPVLAAPPAPVPEEPRTPVDPGPVDPGPVDPGPVDPVGDPVRVRIPAIDADVPLVGVGLAVDGSMAVPDFGVAGWYTPGPAPGLPGPAVLAGHVDSRDGPDVFFRLHELSVGDAIHVEYAGGDEVSFAVRELDHVDKDELPHDRIWPVTAERLLTLITCGGTFDREVRSYEDNVLVFAERLV
jgi:LPXTG-site transpeptidase (sortase) family protein